MSIPSDVLPLKNSTLLTVVSSALVTTAVIVISDCAGNTEPAAGAVIEIDGWATVMVKV